MNDKDKECREAFEQFWNTPIPELTGVFIDSQSLSNMGKLVAWKAYQAAWNRRAPEGLIEFVREVAQQTPEKPDYWSSCGQCERNANKAQEILEAAPLPAAPDKGEL